MISMIRKIALALIFLTSCSNIAYSEQARFIVGYFSSFESDTVSEEYFKNAKFSFANVKIGRGPASTIVLAYINDGVYEWRSADNIKIYTNKEILVRSSGFETDARYFYDVIPQLVDGFSGSGFLTFRNPDLIRAKFSYEIENLGDAVITRFGKDVNVTLFKETIYVPLIKWHAENIYYKSEDGNIIRSINEHNPRVPKIKIDFFYK